jgi:hypothetical protein
MLRTSSTCAQRVREPLDHLGREAQAHQLVEDLLL